MMQLTASQQHGDRALLNSTLFSYMDVHPLLLHLGHEAGAADAWAWRKVIELSSGHEASRGLSRSRREEFGRTVHRRGVDGENGLTHTAAAIGADGRGGGMTSHR